MLSLAVFHVGFAQEPENGGEAPAQLGGSAQEGASAGEEPEQEEGQEEASPQDETIRVDVNLVTLRFTVQDEQGHFLNSLDQRDFQVLENGEEQELVFFEAPRSPDGPARSLWLAFLLDVSGSTFATRAEEILAAQAFFENIHDFTRVGIFGFTDELITFQDFTPNKQAALEAFGAARQHLGRTAIYDSVGTLVSLMKGLSSPDDRKVIIVVSDGMDDRYRRSARAIALARQAGVNLYTIWVPSTAQLYIGPAQSATDLSVNDKDPEEDAKQAVFARLSRETGGRHFGGFQTILDFDEVLAEINDDIFGNLYSVAYNTDRPFLPEEERAIDIAVANPNAAVQGLFKKFPDQLRSKRQFIAALFDADAFQDLPGQMNVRYNEIGAEMDLLNRGGRDASSPGLPFRVKISPFSLQGNRTEGVRTQLGIIGLLLDSEGNEVVRLREIFRAHLGAKEVREGRGIIYTNKLFAPPGNYEFKLAVLEIPTWRMTVFQNSVRIAP